MKYKSLLYILPFALGLSACSDEDTVDGSAASGAEGIVFAANISEYQSRLSADGGSWTEGDRIGAYMFAEGGDLIPFSGNVPYACTGSEQLVTFHSEAPLQFPEDGSSVEFKAYYPYSDSIVNDIYALTLDDQRAGTAAYDLMYAVSDKSWSQTDEAPSVALNFSHCLSKVILRFVGTDGTPMEAENVTIQGMQNHVALNLRTGNLSAQASKDTIAVFSAADGGHEAILYPCSLADQTVAYTVNGNEGSWTFSNNEASLSALEAGYVYTFTLRVSDSGDVVGSADVEESGNSTAPWGDGESTSGVATASKYTLFPRRDGAYADTELKIAFESAPELGTSGKIQIWKADNLTEPVDVIDMSERNVPLIDNSDDVEDNTFNTWMDVVGSSDRRLVVNYEAVRVVGNDIVIKPHSQKLEYGTSYFVTVDKEAVKHADFNGINTSKWFFTTRTPDAKKANVTVSHSGNADFYTLQGAIDYFTNSGMKDENKTITLGAETYNEIVFLRNLSNLTIKGQGDELTTIQSFNNNTLNPGTRDGFDQSLVAGLKPGDKIPIVNGREQAGGRAGVLIGGDADKIRFEDLSMRCTWPNKVQAEVLCIRNRDENAVAFVRCSFYSQQDTLLPGGGWNWFYQCYVEGDTDFIWGGNMACLLEGCDIEMITSGGRGFNARVDLNNIGYVFMNCSLTVRDGVTNCRLLEGSGTAGYDNMTFINSTIAPEFFSGGICSTDRALNPRPDNKVDGDTGVQDGCKMYNCTDGNGKSVLDYEVYGIDQVFSLSEQDYNTYFKDRATVLGGYGDASWFTE